MQPDQYDAIVVGGGIAGLTAANRLGQLNKRVLVLERGTDEKYLCATRVSGGTFHVCERDLMSGEEELVQFIEAATSGTARPELARAVAHDAPRAVRWLEAEGTRFVKLNTALMNHRSWVLGPVGKPGPGLNWQGLRGDVLLQTLESNLIKRGGKLIRGARAKTLIMEKGRCVGLEAELANGMMQFRADAVVIADGGFQSNLELVGTYITPHPEKLRQRNVGSGIGDGLKMAEKAGAALVGLNRFYGHLNSIDAFHNDKLWPYPYLDLLAQAGIVVQKNGLRFADEGRGGVYLANMVAALDDPLSAVIIFDHAIWEEPARATLIAANPHLREQNGTIHEANDLESLAAKAGISPAALRDTVAAYNAAYEAGTLTELSPSRIEGRRKPWPIKKAPFYAVPACAGITYTMGGIAINEFCQVLTSQDIPIPGLFAAGATTGGLEGGPTVGYVGGLVKSTVTGLRAAEKIAG